MYYLGDPPDIVEFGLFYGHSETNLMRPLGFLSKWKPEKKPKVHCTLTYAHVVPNS